MAISVDIPDRLYDYTDEEKAAEAIANFQAANGLSDADIIALWNDHGDPRRLELDRRITAAVDSNGSAKRAQETIPSEIILEIE
jgi:hypothetical protein